jgi:FMN phosphatase YigB (HAD superfamily)
MKLTVLFDLDGTLLQNEDSVFIPAYIELLGNYLGKDVPSQQIQMAVLKATQNMEDNNDPTKTLEECFDDYFYPKIGLTKSNLQNDIDLFYREFFPDLRIYNSELEEAKSLTKKLIDQGTDLVIATNPLFPRIAITQRILWANLRPKIEDYTLITSYENFHFAKPNPAYYAEILANLGWPDNPVVMVGNDWKRDILPAEKIGIPTFFLGGIKEESLQPTNTESSQGNWNDLELWIEKIILSGSSMEPENSIEAFIAILLSTAAVIDNLLRISKKITYWNRRPIPTEWSLVEIISHLADVDSDVNLPRMNLIQDVNIPFLPAISTDEWANERNYIKNNPIEEMERFLQNRKKLINILSSMPNEKLEKQVNHAIFGPTKILEIIKFITQHDRIHINQIHNTISLINSKNN